MISQKEVINPYWKTVESDGNGLEGGLKLCIPSVGGGDDVCHEYKGRGIRHLPEFLNGLGIDYGAATAVVDSFRDITGVGSRIMGEGGQNIVVDTTRGGKKVNPSIVGQTDIHVDNDSGDSDHSLAAKDVELDVYQQEGEMHMLRNLAEVARQYFPDEMASDPERAVHLAAVLMAEAAVTREIGDMKLGAVRSAQQALTSLGRAQGLGAAFVPSHIREQAVLVSKTIAPILVATAVNNIGEDVYQIGVDAQMETSRNEIILKKEKDEAEHEMSITRKEGFGVAIGALANNVLPEVGRAMGDFAREVSGAVFDPGEGFLGKVGMGLLSTQPGQEGVFTRIVKFLGGDKGAVIVLADGFQTLLDKVGPIRTSIGIGSGLTGMVLANSIVMEYGVVPGLAPADFVKGVSVGVGCLGYALAFAIEKRRQGNRS